MGTYWVLLNLYFRELGLTEGLIGRILSTQAFGTVLMAIPASILAVKFHLKWLLTAAAVFTAGSSAMLVSVHPTWLLMMAAGLTGGAYIIHHVVSAPFFMRNSTPKERLHLFGVNHAVEILASVAGVAGGGWIAEHLGKRLDSELWGFRITLLAAAVLLSIAIIPYLLIRSPTPPKPQSKTGFRVWRVRRPGLLLKLMTPSFLIGCGAGLIIPFLNLYFRDRFDLEAGAIGQIFAASQLLTAVGFILGPALAGRFGMIRTVVAAEIFSIPFFVAMAFTSHLEIAVIAFWFRGALMNMNHPISSNFTMEVVDRDEQTFTNAVKEMTWSLSWAISTQIGGWLIEGHGFTLPMMITVALYFTSSCLYLFFFHDYERKILNPKRAAEAESKD